MRNHKHGKGVNHMQWPARPVIRPLGMCTLWCRCQDEVLWGTTETTTRSVHNSDHVDFVPKTIQNINTQVSSKSRVKKHKVSLYLWFAQTHFAATQMCCIMSWAFSGVPHLQWEPASVWTIKTGWVQGRIAFMYKRNKWEPLEADGSRAQTQDFYGESI